MSKFIVLEETDSIAERSKSVFSIAWGMTKADLKARQFQRMLGPAWWLLEPFLNSVAYFFLTTRLNYSTGDNHFLFIFIATTVWRSFTKCLDVSLLSYVSYGSIIRQTSFPLIALNVAHLFTELFFFGVGFLFIFAFCLLFGTPIGWSVFALVPLVICQMTITLGLMIFLSCVGVYFRDLPAFMSLGLNLVFFVSPSVYEADRLPAAFQALQYINPFYYLFPAYRKVLLHNQWPDMIQCTMWTLVGLTLVYFSSVLYRRLRPGFLRVL